MFSRQQQRRRHIKSTLTYDGRRRKRSQRMITLRKQRREDYMTKRRREMSAHYAEEVHRMLPLIPDMLGRLRSQDLAGQLRATEFFRTILSAEQNPPIDEVIQCGAIPVLIGFLSRFDQGKLQFEALWTITNVCSGSEEHLQFVLRHNVIPVLVRLLQSPFSEVRVQAVWCLGNIAGEGLEYRDACLRCSSPIVPSILQLLRMPNPTPMLLQNTIWTITNLVRGVPAPPFGAIRDFLFALCSILKTCRDPETLSSICWGICFIAQGSEEGMLAFLRFELLRPLVRILGSNLPGIVLPVLHIFGDLVSGDNDQTQLAVVAGFVQALPRLLQNQSVKLLKELLWAISNVASGTVEQIEVLLSTNVLRMAAEFLKHRHPRLRLEAAWIVSNACSVGSVQQVAKIVDFGIIGHLCQMLCFPDATILIVVMEGLEHILQKGRVIQRSTQAPVNPFKMMFERAEGEDRLQALQMHSDRAVYQLSERILNSFFPSEIGRRQGLSQMGGDPGGLEDYGFDEDIEPDDYDFGDDFEY